MIDLSEKSDKYAVGKANTAIDKAIAQAYADGYRDGYKDREDEIPVNLRDNKTEFVDLGLPSGTLWSTDYEKGQDKNLFLPYCETERLSIPTKDQWEELINVCKWDYDKNGAFHEAYCVGPNGKILIFKLTGFVSVNEIKNGGNVYFWISEHKEGDEKSAVCISDNHYTKKTTSNVLNIRILPLGPTQ